MNEMLFSDSWYRVKGLRPKLRQHARIHRHVYRGQEWYVLQDISAGRYHRFSAEAYLIIGLMDGERSLDDIWNLACERLGDDMPTQEEVIALLGQLHRADALMADISPDIAELIERRDQERRTRFWGQLRSPLSIKVPLLDPERFLNQTFPLVRPLFGWLGLTLWLFLAVWALTLLGPNWAALTADVSDRVFSLENLTLIWFLYPLLKIIHELGHAYAVKRWGGEVHEVGIMFLVLMPVPYVDASASLAYGSKYQRMLVGAAGILVELLLAALALIAWSHMEAGPARSVAYNVLLICGVSTLLFNGNPLLRFDAYYVLSDFLEIPNLGARGNRYLGYLFQKIVLGLKGLVSPAHTQGEARWLGGYALAAFLYRVYISVKIILFVAGKFFFIGIVLAIAATVSMVLTPLFKITKAWFNDPKLQAGRNRALLFGGISAATLFLLLMVWPCPSFTVVSGVVWVPEDARVFAGANGFVRQVAMTSGSLVDIGVPLIIAEDPELASKVQILAAQLEEYQARYRSSLSLERAETELLLDEIARLEGELANAKARRHDLVVRSPAKGVFLIESPEDLPGKYITRGMPLGFVVSPGQLQVRVVVPQEEVDLVRYHTRSVAARLSGLLLDVQPAGIIREVPAASQQLPSLALSIEGGGKIALDPKSPDVPKAFKTFFQFDIALPLERLERVGERVFVRFDFEPEPLAVRGLRSVRRVFLKHFAV